MTRNGQSDKRAWLEKAFSDYELSLLRYIKSITQDGERARDIVHDTFLQLCAKERNEVEEHLAQWLFTVSRNLAMNVYRKEKRIRNLRDGEAEGIESKDPSPDLVVEQKETTHEILGLVQTLPFNQQEVIRLKFQCGLTYKEISRITDLSVTNVGFLVHTAIKRIRRQFQSTVELDANRMNSHEYQSR